MCPAFVVFAAAVIACLETVMVAHSNSTEQPRHEQLQA
jgi:hypothetical protein